MRISARTRQSTSLYASTACISSISVIEDSVLLASKNAQPFLEAIGNGIVRALRKAKREKLMKPTESHAETSTHETQWLHAAARGAHAGDVRGDEVDAEW